MTGKKPPFFQISEGRWDEVSRRHNRDAEVLEKNGRYAGALYLKGYAIECTLKRLILRRESLLLKFNQERLLETQRTFFRGSRAHDLLYLFDRAWGERRPGKPVVRTFLSNFVAVWGVDLRYSGGVNVRRALVFLRLADRILAELKN